MIGWLLRMVRNGSAHEATEETPDATEAKHKATLKRADRLLQQAEAYRAADAARRNRAK